MTALFFLAVYSIGLLATIFRHPIFGLYTYFFTFYMSPASTWWRNDVPDLRYLLIIGVVTLLRTLTLPNPDKRSWLESGFAKLIVCFAVYIQLQYFWALDLRTHTDGMVLWVKHIIFIFLLIRLVDSFQRLEAVIFANILGCLYYGYYALSRGGGRLGIAGGTNEVGNHVAAIGLMFTGIMFLGSKGVRRWICFVAGPFILNCLILTVSRGAFLGFFAGGAFGFVASPKRMRSQYIVVGILAIVLLGMLAHDALIQRFQSLYTGLFEEVDELDRSAMSRFDIAKAGFRMGLDHPLGAGWRGTVTLSPYYIPQEYLARDAGGRAAHNTLAAVAAEQGFPGMVLYLSILFWFWRTMVQIKRNARGSPDETQIMLYRLAIGAAMISFLVSGNFHNNLSQETPYWCLAMLAILSRLTRESHAPTGQAQARTNEHGMPEFHHAPAALGHQRTDERHQVAPYGHH